MKIFTLNGSRKNDPRIEEWLADHQNALGMIAADWFSVIRACGNDVTELLHDGYPTACVGDYPFAYVGAFKAHVNVGFFQGAYLSDPAGILEGTGKHMRHVKVKLNKQVESEAIATLIHAAYANIKHRAE